MRENWVAHTKTERNEMKTYAFIFFGGEYFCFCCFAATFGKKFKKAKNIEIHDILVDSREVYSH